MEQSSLTFQTFKNITYNIVGYVWPMFFSIFITPVIIFGLGIKNYGIYLFVNAIISLFGLLDLGIGMAVIKRISYYYGKKDARAIATLTHSANSLFLLVGIVGFLLAVGIALWGPHLLPSQFAAYQQYSMLFVIGGAIFFVATASNTYSSIITGLQRFDISNKIGISSVTISTFSILAVVLLKGSIQEILLVQLLVSTVFALITIHSAKKILPEATLDFGWNRFEIEHCYRFGLVTFVNNIANVALASLDRLIIPLYVGPSNLTYYSVAGNVTGKIPGMSNTLSATMFPTTSQLDGEESKAKIEKLYVRSFRLITIVAAALNITCIAFAFKILQYWLNADFASKASEVLIILAFTNFILALFGPLSSFLLGLGKLRFLTTMSLTMGIANAILLVVLLPRFGIVGAAWAYLLSVLPVIYVFYYTEKNYLTLSNRGHYYAKKLTGTLVTSVIVWAIDIFLLSPFVVNLATLLLMGLVSGLIYLLIYKGFRLFENEDWHDIERFFFAVTRKLKITR